jgi:hypothetical protein
VIVENVEGLPCTADPELVPVAPAPTVIGYAVAPQTDNDEQVLNPPAPPPPPV